MATNEPLTSDAGLPGPVAVDEAARTQLLALARTAVAVASRAEGSGALEAAMHEASATELRASAFVTLTEDDDLRGCMGILDPDRLVHDAVAEAAALATRTDPRFRPVTPEELPRLHLDVSVLGPMVCLADPLAWRLGIDGIVVQLGGRRGSPPARGRRRGQPRSGPHARHRNPQGGTGCRRLARSVSEGVRVPHRALRRARCGAPRSGASGIAVDHVTFPRTLAWSSSVPSC